MVVFLWEKSYYLKDRQDKHYLLDDNVRLVLVVITCRESVWFSGVVPLPIVGQAVRFL